MKTHTKLAVLSGVLAAVFSLSASAGIVTYPFSDTPAGSPVVIPQGGGSLTPAPEINVSTIPSSIITSVELILTFNDSSSLTGNSLSGIQGLLILGTDANSPYVSFSPTGTPVAGSQEQTYTITFSDFNGLDPNNTWVLNLYDNSGSGIENGLVSWTLNIDALVPEPITYALVVFSLAFAGFGARRWYLGRHRSNPAK